MAYFKIMCFNWNAGGLRLCETLNQQKANKTRSGFAFNRSKCVAPNFYINLRDEIIKQNPNLVVITTEDENNKDTYFHAELLPRDMPEHGYQLIKRDVLNDVGEVAAGVKYDKLESGSATGSALRLSIYARNDEMANLHVAEVPKVFTQKASQKGLICGRGSHSGAIASYLWHPRMGTFAFVAVKLTSERQFDRSNEKYEDYRNSIKLANKSCLESIIRNLINNPVPADLKPDHIFLIGDFNSEVMVPGSTNENLIKQITEKPTSDNFINLMKYDELTQSLVEYPLIGFSEGLSAKKGPLFLPTWKMRRGRDQRCEISDGKAINTDCFDGSGGIGWHDRILTKDRDGASYLTNCTMYNRFDIGAMHFSNQAGVVGVYELTEMK